MNVENMFDDTSSDEVYEDDNVSRRTKGKKNKKSRQELTWAEAAEIVLSKSDQALQHKEILRRIEESNLKTRGRGNSAPLAVLNSMLSSNCKGPGAIFYRAPGSACYGLTKNLARKKDSSPTSNLKEDSDIKSKYVTQSSSQGPSPALPQKQLIPPGSSIDKNRLGYGLFSQAYERLKQQHPFPRRMGPTTSAFIRPVCSRPPPGAALRVMPPKKRVKLDDDSDSDNSSKSSDSRKDRKFPSRQPSPQNSQQRQVPRNVPSVTPSPALSRRESQRSQNKVISKPTEADFRLARSHVPSKIKTKPPVKNDTSINSKQFFRNNPKPNPPTGRNISNLKSFNNKLSTVSSLNSLSNKSIDDSQKQPTTFLGVTFKRMKKANLADQIKRSKEGKLDLMTPDSILTSVHIKDFLHESTFQVLPPAYQYQLMVLLPECDRKVGGDGGLRLNAQSLNNGFFNRSCQEFKDKLMDGEFNSDIIQRAKNEVNVYSKLDPWKKQFFEPVYGSKTIDDVISDDSAPPPPVQPVETSWKTFLKFAENSTDDFEKALAKIQEEAQKNAATQEAAKREKEKMKKERECLKRMSPSAKFSTKKFSSLSPNIKSSLHARSPVSLKHKFANRSEGVTKEKCRRAVKKAHQLQRKKQFDKQLQDAKARLVEEARFGARNVNPVTLSNQINKTDNSHTLTQTLSSELNIPEKENEISTDALKDAIGQKNEENNIDNTVIDLRDSSALRNLIKKSDQINKTQQKKKSVISSGSRIAIGPSSFNGNGNVCPCNLKAMVTCSKCGLLWHSNCMNGTKICGICAR